MSHHLARCQEGEGGHKKPSLPHSRMPHAKKKLSRNSNSPAVYAQTVHLLRSNVCAIRRESVPPYLCRRGGSDFPYKLTEECRAAYPFHIAAQYISGDGHLLRGFLLFSLLRVLWPSPLLLLSRGGRKGRVDVGIVYREKKNLYSAGR